MRQPIFQHKIDMSNAYEPSANVSQTFKRFGFVAPAEAAMSELRRTEKQALDKRKQRAKKKR